MLNCRQVTRLYSESQERKLSLKEGMELKLHVMMCKGCRNFGEQMVALRQIMRTYARGGNEPGARKPDTSSESKI